MHVNFLRPFINFLLLATSYHVPKTEDLFKFTLLYLFLYECNAGMILQEKFAKNYKTYSYRHRSTNGTYHAMPNEFTYHTKVWHTILELI